MAPLSKNASTTAVSSKQETAGEYANSDLKSEPRANDFISPRSVGIKDQLAYFSAMEGKERKNSQHPDQDEQKVNPVGANDEQKSGMLQTLRQRKRNLTLLGSPNRTKLGNPGLPLFSADSGEPGRSSGKLMQMFSWGRSPALLAAKGEDRAAFLMKKRSSLVPAGYENVFTDNTPPLTIASKSEWSLEVVTLLNNGLRHELADMYAILIQMEQRPLTLTIDDMDLFFQWLSVFTLAARAIFDLEEKALYAWIEGKDMQSAEDKKWCEAPQKIKGDLSEGKRMLLKGDILQHLEKLDDSGSDMFFGRPVIEKLGELAESLDAMVKSLCRYLDCKESKLPVIIIQHSLTQKDRKRLETHQWNAIIPLASGDKDFARMIRACITRWMTPAVFSKWRKKWVPSFTKTENGLCRDAYYKKHYRAVKDLADRLLADEEERTRAAEEQGALRARVSAIPDDAHTEHIEFEASEAEQSEGASEKSSMH